MLSRSILLFVLLFGSGVYADQTKNWFLGDIQGLLRMPPRAELSFVIQKEPKQAPKAPYAAKADTQTGVLLSQGNVSLFTGVQFGGLREILSGETSLSGVLNLRLNF